MYRCSLIALFAIGCGGGSSATDAGAYDAAASPVGALNGPCLLDGSCDQGLFCVGDICRSTLDMVDAAGSPADPFEPGAVNQLIGAPIRTLDVLVVVDNSNSMALQQAQLASNFSRFTDALDNAFGGLPDLHVGVVSTDLGTGPFESGSCTGMGDNGLLQNTPKNSFCNAPSDLYISDAPGSGSGRVTNYTGTLSDTFGCIAALGTNGCSFEQPLQSMRRALDGTNSENAGFLRDDAMLAVLVLSDEDDCSTRDTAMFDDDPTLNNISSSLGQLSSFRCFEFGVQCDPDTPRVAGSRTACEPRNDSQYMYGVGEYAAFLRSLKTAGGHLFFSTIAGVGPVSVGLQGGYLRLEVACASNTSQAVPAVRMASLTNELGMPPSESICNDIGVGLDSISTNLIAMMSGRCLVAEPVGGGCRLADVSDFGGVGEAVVQDLPSCATSTTGACTTFTPNSTNCEQATEVQVDRRGTTVPPDTVVVASCPQ